MSDDPPAVGAHRAVRTSKSPALQRVADAPQPVHDPAAEVQSDAPSVAGNRAILAALRGQPVGGIAGVAVRRLVLMTAGVHAPVPSPSEVRAHLRSSGLSGDEDAALHGLSGAGQPLPDAVRERLEAAFGHDFSHVRVHTDGTAARAAEELRAHAFALGADVFFGSGEFAPGTPAGDRLLAHELTHVVQADEGRLPTGGGVSSPTDTAEQEAYGNEDRILSALQTLGAYVAANPGIGGEWGRGGEARVPAPGPAEAPVHRDGEVSEAANQAKDTVGYGIQLLVAYLRRFLGSPELPQIPGGASGGTPGSSSRSDGASTADASGGTGGQVGTSEPAASGGGAQGQAAPPEGQAGTAEAQAGAENGSGAVATPEQGADAATADQGAAAGDAAASAGGGTPDRAAEATAAHGAAAAGPTSTPGGGTVPSPPPLPTRAEAGGATEAPSPRPVDGMVDAYMGFNWSSEAFHTIAHDIGYPGDVGGVEFVDRVLPPDISPEARAAIHVVSGIATGVLDHVIIAEAASHIGVSGDFANSIVSIVKDVGAFVELKDPVGIAVYAAITAGLGILDGLEGFVKSTKKKVASLQAAADVLAAVGWALGQSLAVVSAVLGPEAVGVVEGTISSIAGTVEGINAALEFVRVPVQVALIIIDTMQMGLHVVDHLYTSARALEEQARGEGGKAEKYKVMARGAAFKAFQEWFSAVVNTAFAIPLLGQKADAVKRTTFGTAKMVATKGLNVGLRVASLGTVDSSSFPGAGDVLGLMLSEVADHTDWFHDYALYMGNAMKTDPSDYVADVPVAGVGAAAGMVQAARARTFAWLEVGHQDLLGSDPDWHQQLVNDLIAPETSLDEALSPTYWILKLLDSVPWLAHWVADSSMEAVASGAETAATWLPRAQPFADYMTLALLSLKENLDEIVGSVDQLIQEQDVSLENLQTLAERFREGLDTIDAMGDQYGPIGSSIDQVKDTLDGMRVDVGNLGLPSFIPAGLVAPRVELLNGAIDEVIEFVDEQGNLFRERFDTGIEAITKPLEAKVAQFQDAISETGDFRKELDQHVAAFKDQVHEAAEAFASWDGKVTIDTSAAAAWLTTLAQAARAAVAEDTEEERSWAEVVAQTAQPYVDQWRAQHGDSVKSQYEPEIPQWEIDACRAAAAAVHGMPGALPTATLKVDGALAVVEAFEGGHGRERLYAFWAAVQVFTAAVSQAEAGGA